MLPDGVGSWVRAEDYEVYSGPRGLYIRPVPQSPMKAYDPWKERLSSSVPRRKGERTRTRSKPTPYLALTNLLDHPELERARGAMVASLSAEAEAELLDWCRRNGLLGLAQHQIRSVTLPARPELWDETSRRPYPTVRRYDWLAGAWPLQRTQTFRLAGGARASSPPSSRLPDHAGDEGSRSAGVSYRPINGEQMLRWEQADFRRWTDYFPAIAPSSGDWPAPAGERFWREYGEPLGEFLNAAADLRDVLTAALAHRRRPRPDAQRIEMFFNRFLDRVVPVIVRKRQGWDAHWAAPSLLATLAFMARDDLAEQALHQCASPDCHRLFRSKAREVMYCSPRCRTREQKRREARERRHAEATADK